MIMYSAKLIEKIEANDGQLPLAQLADDSGEDISSLVIDSVSSALHLLIKYTCLQDVFQGLVFLTF